MYLLGYDLGSSSVKASLVNAATGECVSTAFFPKKEMEIISLKKGWAEQNPDLWWENLKAATKSVLEESAVNPSDIKAIGISYQMHGLVLVDENMKAIRNSIIWCDSRAVPFGEKAFEALGAEKCLSHLLNSPGNFTLSKLAWVKENEPQNFSRIKYYMLPGDYIAMRMTGKPCTTASGLSEGMGWDFETEKPASFLFDYFGFEESTVPEIVSTFGHQGSLTVGVAQELGLAEGTPVTYRAGDQPNNALSLNVLNPGEIAATAGTSGVVYGVNSDSKYDPQSRVNSFAHVNHTEKDTRIGVLLCINGTAILNTWIKNNVAPEGISYAEMNELAAAIPVGSEGVSIVPFGNGAERVLGNKEPNCSIHGVNFNRISKAHLIRAAHEGIAFSFKYGMDIMNQMGIETKTIRAGHANLFLSPIFRQTLANITGATIELYNTDGSVGAARGAGIGAGIYKNPEEAFATLKKIMVITPQSDEAEATMEAYKQWINKIN
ncbi:MAG TPA: FGGY family carbohydrate kinase [Paludibacteraceae bacterium]|nr:FGGY family carbohydrate kinase [Paludibacteraceae bacterium]HPT43681.1 FGGY family carbohydrate kinase [Paludibacteraceae bacterium]